MQPNKENVGFPKLQISTKQEKWFMFAVVIHETWSAKMYCTVTLIHHPVLLSLRALLFLLFQLGKYTLFFKLLF